MDQSVQSHSVQCTIRYEDCRRVYRHQDLPSEVETGELGGSECGVVTVAVERGREGGRGREREREERRGREGEGGRGRERGREGGGRHFNIMSSVVSQKNIFNIQLAAFVG